MPVDNPVETIGAARARLARLAAIRAMLCAVAPALTAIALGLLLEPIGSLTWARYGYSLAPDRANVLSLALVGAGIVVLAAGLVMAFRAYRRADDFVSAAAELDDRLECNQEIVTFATLADPSAPESGRARRTPLFPILWRRAIALFGGLDVRREFRLEVGEPLKRSSIFAGVVALAMVLATLGLVRAPTPANREAAKLRAIAEEIAKTATGPGDTALADKIRAAADALESPELPPEEKKKRIEDAMREANHAAEKRNISEAGKNQAAGKSTAQSGKGNGKSQGQGNSSGTGSGQAKAGTGSGQTAGGNNPGSGNGGAGNNSGKNDGGNGSAKNDKNDRNKGANSNIELNNELAKAEAQVETPNEESRARQQAWQRQEPERRQQARRQARSERRQPARSQPSRRDPEARRQRRSQYSVRRRQSQKQPRHGLEHGRYASRRDADVHQCAALPEARREGLDGRYQGCALRHVPPAGRAQVGQRRENCPRRRSAQSDYCLRQCSAGAEQRRRAA